MNPAQDNNAIRSIKPYGDEDALLLLEDGTALFGYGFGAKTKRLGELCFNTAMSGYQEIMSDPSYAGQIINFTCPHIGNVGCNDDDLEAHRSFVSGVVVRARVTPPSNQRSTSNLSAWLAGEGIPAISGLDTRTLTRRIRDQGSLRALLLHADDASALSDSALPALLEEVRGWQGLVGADLAGEVSCTEHYDWDKGLWSLQNGSSEQKSAPPSNSESVHVVAVDYGIKQNILRMLVSHGARVTVVPAATSADALLALKPDGLFLSNGPGDPAATGSYAESILAAVMGKRPHLPIFGICLGHQILGRTLGLDTEKLLFGHHGANHPVLEHESGRVLVTSQNHNFCINSNNASNNTNPLTFTHTSLFDNTNQGLKLTDRQHIFSVQFHPEASPGPHDAHHLFTHFINTIHATRNPQNAPQ